MTWLGLDDQILNHPKFIRAVKLGGSETVHTWLGIRAYCAQNRTDGFVPADMLEEIRGPLGAEKRAAAVKVLRKVGLLDSAVGGVQMHNFSKWLDRQFGARQAELGKKGGSVSSEGKRLAAIKREADRRIAQEKSTSDDHNEPQAACAFDHKPEPQQTTSLSSSGSSPVPEERDPPTPVPEPNRTGPMPPDRFAASFGSMRADVVELHAAYKRTFGLGSHRLAGPTDFNATILAEAIDAHGLEKCVAALGVAKADSWVNGAADKGERHEKISYVFGNADTLARLLRAAAEKRKNPGIMGNGFGPLERAMTAEPDTSDVYVPVPRSAE